MASDGDSIIVKAGIYKESNIIISKSIHIRGEKNAVVDGGSKESIFSVSADNFSIQSLTIKNVGKSYVNDYAAILVSKSKYFSISKNVFENVFFGILVEKSHYGLISHNRITGKADNEANSGNGIHLWHCWNMRIENNFISGLRDGIYFEFVKKSSISNNTSKNNLRYGLHFMFSNNDEYFRNEFKNNGAGVAVMFSKFIKMHHNTFHFNWGMASYGLLLKEIYDAEIENNYFEQNTIGINIENCSRVKYINNNFIRNGWALKFSGGSYENVFELNNFLNNSFDLSYNSKLNDNKFEGNYWSEYTGYDLDKDGIGDVPYRPVKLFSYVVNSTPGALVLLRSLFVDIINFSEKVSPVFTPDNLVDDKPIMKRLNDRN
jgi:nitrous oxidase accessory protein